MFLIRYPFLLIFGGVLIESMLVAKVGSQLGWTLTFLLLVSGMVGGAMLMRRQGFQTFRRLQIAMARGENPGPDILEGVMIMSGGLLLMMPGFVSDAMGVLLMIPVFRRGVLATLERRLSRLPLAANVVQAQWTYDYRPGHGPRPTSAGEVYEGERGDNPMDRAGSQREFVEILMMSTREGEVDPAQATSTLENASPSGVIEGEFVRKED